MKKILFVCIHNSARSQIAEALLKKLAPGSYDVESAGIEPGSLNPLALEVLKEEGIDITGKPTQSVFDLHAKGRRYDYVVTVCDESQSEKCPVFPGPGVRIHWSLPDPSKFEGDWEEKLFRTRMLREQIKRNLIDWIHEHGTR